MASELLTPFSWNKTVDDRTRSYVCMSWNLREAAHQHIPGSKAVGFASNASASNQAWYQPADTLHTLASTYTV